MALTMPRAWISGHNFAIASFPYDKSTEPWKKYKIYQTQLEK